MGYIEREAALRDWPLCDEPADAYQYIRSYPAADVRPVVLCRDCYWWMKQEASIQGRCSRLGMYPTGNWYCANGQKRMEKS